jgi:hypothetical protein
MSIPGSLLAVSCFHIEITRRKPDRLDKPIFSAFHGLVWALWVTWL